jgi:hypothetical protein
MAGLVRVASMLAIASAYLAACTQPTENSLKGTDTEIRTLGYTSIRPPSNLPATGSIVLVRSAEPFVLQVICQAGEVIGPLSQNLTGSGTVSSSWERQTGLTGSLGASYLDRINAKLGGKLVRGVNYSLANARVTELSDAELRRAIQGGALTSDCRQAVEARRRSGATLTMVQSALVADVTYALVFETGVDVGVKVAALGEIAPELNAAVADQGQGTLKGEAMIWGIRDDGFLLTSLGGGGQESGAPALAVPADGVWQVLPREPAAVLPP